MEEKTLRQLYDGLDAKTQTKLISMIVENLLTTPATAFSYVRGYRSVPMVKRPKLDEIVGRNFATKLKYPKRPCM